MNTPIVDFVKGYIESEKLRLHMPGHKGKSFLGFEQFDITEIDGADLLYSAKGIIKESENNATALFGTKKTFYSTEGSSLAIRAMLYLAKMYGYSKGEKPLIFAGRNAHKTFLTAASLLDFNVEWLLPKESNSLISLDITADFIEEKFKNSIVKPVAVYITTPDYLGNIVDIKEIATVCHKYGVLLLVDNAHGAYLNFLKENIHPIHLGADICCDSAHKTLPVLTGGAYLHISNTSPEIFAQKAEMALSLFASTSPSYLILQSLDFANKYLSDNYSKKLNIFIKEITNLKNELSAFGFTLVGNEPLKLTIASKSYGYKGYELAEILEKKGIICEFSDPDFIVFMFSLETEKEDLKKLKNELLIIEKKQAITEITPTPSSCKMCLSLNKAIFTASEEISVEESIGRIYTDTAVSCPPAIPIVVCGEKIDENSVNCFKYYGIKSVLVAKE